MPRVVKKFSNSLAKVIRRHRQKIGLSQEALAGKAGVHRMYVGMIERGERSPTCDVAYRIAKALDLPLAQLVEEVEKRL